MDMEQWLVHLMRIELMIELRIILLCQVSRFASPRWIGVIDHILLACLHLFAVLPLLFHAKSNLYWQEFTILGQQALYRCIFQILSIFLIDMQHNVCSTLSFDGLLHSVFWRTIARPMHSLRILFVTQREDLYLVCHHKS